MVTTTPTVERFMSNTGVTIYRIPMHVFPGFVGYSYVLLGAGVPTLVDVGSGFGNCSEELQRGLAAIHSDYGEDFRMNDIARVIISHGHIDHFGGLPDLLSAIGTATVGVHPLDRRVLTNYEERRTIATNDLTIFLERAGVRDERMAQLIDMYGISKQHFQSVDVHFMFDDGAVIDGLEFHHVPGHCSGQVAIRIGDVLLSADHVLSRTSPHVAAESITNYTGLGHYRDALRKIRQLQDIRLVMGGHEDVMDDLHGRIDAIQARIDEKLYMMLDLIRSAGEPLSIVEISKRRYPDKHGFDVLLALQEAGAFVEYLYDRGYLEIANLAEVESAYNPVVQYQVLDGAVLD